MKKLAPRIPVFSKEITDAYHGDEKLYVGKCIKAAELPPERIKKIQKLATKLIKNVRDSRLKRGGIDAFMMQYDLSSEEGIALMCLAEALLRIPDADTADKLIQDKISKGDWESHAGKSDSTFVNAATWSLMLTGKLVNPNQSTNKIKNALKSFLTNNTEGVIRKAVRHAMKIMGKQFVMGETIKSAQTRAKKAERMGYTYSYDMLGEAARTDKDALFYLQEYRDAIHALGKLADDKGPIANAGISIKLSALSSRYEVNKFDDVHDVLYARAKELCLLAKEYDLNLNIDAEEADRFEIDLTLFERLALDKDLDGWAGLGTVMQAYQKRTLYALEWLRKLAVKSNRRFMVRLVKGAYWDYEIKHAQVEGLAGYPVFTQKVNTDVSYIACAKLMLGNPEQFYCQFATHNAYSLSTILEIAGVYKDFEFQCLHGMGDTLYDQVVGKDNLDVRCRIYAPVGTHEHLLAYLVRRLLENGANSSFVNRIVDENLPISELVKDPIAEAIELGAGPHPKIPLPRDIYGDRINSKGMDLSAGDVLHSLSDDIKGLWDKKYKVGPITSAKITKGEIVESINPANISEVVAEVASADDATVNLAVAEAVKAFDDWTNTPATVRSNILRKAADLLEENMNELMLIAVREAGKTWANAVAEVREAVDFCRYYANMGEKYFAESIQMPGPTGEDNQFYLSGRGPIVCISPWNFPLAIFLGQVTAALASGNTVLTKPAAQTSLIAHRAVELLIEAGVPKNVIHFLPGGGRTVGAALVAHPDIRGVMFTGSTEVAQGLNQVLAAKDGPIVPFIAETGGQNSMIVDSSALPEQVVRDAVNSAFDSAGQRCSALRVLYIQDDVAESTMEMLVGAMQELTVGDPADLENDIGPVIDAGAQKGLNAHIKKFKAAGKLVYQCPLPKDLKGTYVAPTLFELDSISELVREQFGPILHVIRYKAKDFQKVIDAINGTGYGLTFGLHTRIELRAAAVTKQIKAGNLYVNRNTVGAVVGVQPFGGQGLSGTGPKAGGPYYLLRLATEHCISTDTTASGGNASLMSL